MLDRSRVVGILLITLMSILATEVRGQSSPRRVIYLEISADARARVGAQQQWLEMLQGVGADRVVSRTLRDGRVGIEETDMTNATRHQGFGSDCRQPPEIAWR